MLSMGVPILSKSDLDRLYLGLSENEWRSLSRKRIFITGGSGFIGKWFLSALITANQRLSLNCKIEILTRSKNKFYDTAPQIAFADGVILHEGDVRNFDFPKGLFDIVVHAATDVAVQQKPFELISTCVDGTKRVLEFSRLSKAQDFLLTSSGAVYGQHPSDPGGFSENYLGAPDQLLPSSAYAEGKRISELLASIEAHNTKLKVKIARIYAQVGPYLPMNKHFAIGNFISDALAGREIIVRGDGTPFRSYLYAADTAVWLWSMLIKGGSGRVWNVGGDEALSIASLAQRVSSLLGSKNNIKIMKVAQPGVKYECYMPNTNLARRDLALPQALTLDESILRTANWVLKHIQILK